MLTVAVPTWVPAVGQVVGAVVWGPKTLKVMVPEALEPEERRGPSERAVLEMVVPAVPVVGPLTVSVGVARPPLSRTYPRRRPSGGVVVGVAAVGGVPPVVTAPVGV